MISISLEVVHLGLLIELATVQVDAIQDCGGQLTADGKRFRSSGGILWNILKTREPKAYKEIMTKGKEFEVQKLSSSIASK